MGGAPTYRAEPFRVAILGLNEITDITQRSFADGILNFLRFGSGGGGGDSNISSNTAIPPQKLKQKLIFN